MDWLLSHLNHCYFSRDASSPPFPFAQSIVFTAVLFTQMPLTVSTFLGHPTTLGPLQICSPQTVQWNPTINTEASQVFWGTKGPAGLCPSSNTAGLLLTLYALGCCEGLLEQGVASQAPLHTRLRRPAPWYIICRGENLRGSTKPLQRVLDFYRENEEADRPLPFSKFPKYHSA